MMHSSNSVSPGCANNVLCTPETTTANERGPPSHAPGPVRDERERKFGAEGISSGIVPSFSRETSMDASSVKRMTPHTSVSTAVNDTGDSRVNATPAMYNASPMPNPPCFSSRMDDSSPESAGDILLLELVLPVTVQFLQVNEGQKLLGFCLQCGKASQGISRVIRLRLTDPLDPFFLYEMELLEEDYGIFKQELELVVDFNGFPRFLADMFQGIDNSTLPYTISFLGQGGASSRGMLRIVEHTHFRTMEQLSLCLIRQGDAAQKKYLAERFQHFEKAFKRGSSAWKVEREQLMNSLEESRQGMDNLLGKYQLLQENLRASEAYKEQECNTAISSLRIQHEQELKKQCEEHNTAVKHLQDNFHRSQQELLADLRQKNEILQELQQRYNELDTKHARIDGDHRLLQANSKKIEEEAVSLRFEIRELTKSRDEALEKLKGKDLAHATLTERINGLVAAVEARSEECESLKGQHAQQNTIISSLTSQNKQLSENVSALEKNIEKAHYIIGTQLQSLRNVKDRYKIATERIRTQEQLLEERQVTVNRLREELENVKEKLLHSRERNSQLEAEVEKASNTNKDLSEELQTTRGALIKTYKSTNLRESAFPQRLVYSTPTTGHIPFSLSSNITSPVGGVRFHSPFHSSRGAEGTKETHFSQATRPSSPKAHPGDSVEAMPSSSTTSLPSSASNQMASVVGQVRQSTFSKWNPSLSSSREKDSPITPSRAALLSTREATPSPGHRPRPFSNAPATSVSTNEGGGDMNLESTSGDTIPTATEVSPHNIENHTFKNLGKRDFTAQIAEKTLFGLKGAMAMPRSAYFS